MNDTELIDKMVQRLGVELKGVLSKVHEGDIAAGSVEGVLRQELWHVGNQALGVILEAMDRQLTSDRPVYDHRTRTVVSLFGPLDICRGRCHQDGQWQYPLDEVMGLWGHHSWTVGLRETVSLLSCDSSFENVSDLMDRLFGLPISAPSVQKIAENAGSRALEMPDDDPAVVDRPPDTLIVATDGCMAPRRDGWHEVKVATIYPKSSRCVGPKGRRRLTDKEYYASSDPAGQFGDALWERTRRWGSDHCDRVVVMGDGARWIWNLADLHFPGAIEIVDVYHAAEHLWTVGEALWGDRQTSPATRSWSRRYCKYLKAGRLDLVLRAIQRARRSRSDRLTAKDRKIITQNLAYFERNAHRMRYGRFRQMKLPIGTGAVEGSCRFVVQSRLKRPGARWSPTGLDNMLALKLARLNNRWEQIWPHLNVA
jgi:hypothetical protein